MNIAEFAKDSYAHWNAHDVDALVAEFVPGGLDMRPNHPDGITGEAFAEFLRGVFVWSSDFAVDMVSLQEFKDGSGFVTEWEIHGTNDGVDTSGSPASGKTYRLKGVTINDLEGDKIKQSRVYFDLLALMQQLAPSEAAAEAAGRD
jgi:steroid delta-isomerase-like uncharacterized protein